MNLNYATYFSTLSTVNKFESDRTAGGRLGFFLPGPRIEVGASFQKELQEERAKCLWISFCLAAFGDSTQPAFRVRPLA
jgi:hypothetical protein